jgi:hypothetical protein
MQKGCQPDWLPPSHDLNAILSETGPAGTENSYYSLKLKKNIFSFTKSNKKNRKQGLFSIILNK